MINFWKNSKIVKALIDVSNKINTITTIYALKLGFQVENNNVKAWKISKSSVSIFEIVMTIF